MKRMFTFDPTPFAAELAAKEFVRIPQGLTPTYLDSLRRQVNKNLETGLMANFAIGDKQQAMYQFPDHEHLREFLDMVGKVCGLEPDLLVISERHIKAYEADADPYPLAHKDRLATQIAVGFSVNVPAGSTLLLWPNAERGTNPFNTSTELRKSLRREQLPETTLKGVAPVEIQDAPGDVMMFRGNSIWHLRNHAAGTVMVYFKLNAFHCDPLGEDPRTPEYQARTRQLAAAADEVVMEAIAVLGRRVDYIHHRYNRHWEELTGVVLWGEKHLTIDEEELQALKAMDGKRTVREVIRAVKGGADDEALLKKLRQLAERSIVDLLPAPAVGHVHADKESTAARSPAAFAAVAGRPVV
jgi:hypothetical protein